MFLLAFGSWFVADEPMDSRLVVATTRDSLPVWRVAEMLMGVCLIAMAVALILGALVVAILRARGRKVWAALGHGVSALLIGGSAAVLVSTMALHPDTPPANPALSLSVLVVGGLVGMIVLGNAAVRARSDRRTAQLVAIPAATVWVVLLTAVVALVGYAVDLVVHGVPVITDAMPGVGDPGSVHVYPIDALPTGHAVLLPALILSLVAGLAALAGATYATVGAVRGLRIAATRA
jgi:hypothetical protein